MRTIPTLIAIIVTSFNAYAVDDEVVIKEMANRTTLRIEEIRMHYKTGCDSGITPYMNICSSYHNVAADMELNEVYQALIKQLTTKQAKEKLVKAQRVWLSFRDLTCDYESDGWVGGTGESMNVLSCKARITGARTNQLKEYLNCTSPGCPGEW